MSREYRITAWLPCTILVHFKGLWNLRDEWFLELWIFGR